MGRIAKVLDEQVDYGFEGGPGYSTGVVELENGFEERESEWEFARHRYSASFGEIEDDDRDAIIATFHTCRGRRHSFLFKDWNDFVADGEEVEVPVEYEGTTDPIQMYKRYTFMNQPYLPGDPYTIRVVQALKSATLYQADGVTPVPGVFNLLTGTFTPTDPWAAGVNLYRWSGEFYVWVRFEADYNPMTINSWRANTASVDLLEDKFEFTATNVPRSWEE